MTPTAILLLRRAAERSVYPGTSLLLEANNGNMRTVRSLIQKKLVRLFDHEHGGMRVVATGTGRKKISELAYDPVAKRIPKPKPDALLAALRNSSGC